MTKLFRVLVILSFGLVLVGCAAVETPEQKVAAVKKLDAQYMESFGKGDLASLMEAYWKSPELVLYPPDALEAKGWDNVRAGLGNFMKNAPGAKMELVEPQYTAAGDAVIVWGKWKMTVPDPKGDHVMIGRFTEVAMKKDGKWVLVHDHPSLPMMPPSK